MSGITDLIGVLLLKENMSMNTQYLDIHDRNVSFAMSANS